jgi:hypothetical protein
MDFRDRLRGIGSARLGIDFWAPLKVFKYGLCVLYNIVRVHCYTVQYTAKNSITGGSLSGFISIPGVTSSN